MAIYFVEKYKMYKFLKNNDLRLNLIQKDDDG